MSRPQVTITLGRSGQVVKRPENSSADYVPSSSTSGTKRSVRDRLGNIGDNPSMNGNQPTKRQRRDGARSLDDDDEDGVPVNPNDLRYKLMRKKMFRNDGSDDEENRSVDLREKLSRAAQPQMRTVTRQRIPERKPTTRQRMPEPKANGTRQRMPESNTINTRQRMPEPKASGLLRQSPPSRSRDHLDQMESLRKSYSGWTLDELRRRSPDRLLRTSRVLSPPRRSPNRVLRSSRDLSPPRRSPNRLLRSSRDLSPPRSIEIRRPVGHMSSLSHVDPSRSASYIGKDVYGSSRPTSYMPKASAPLEAGNPVGRLPTTAPGITPKVSYIGEEVTVSSLLHSLDLGKYAILFQAEEVDMHALKQMSDHDLKDLGIPMGPRKKILLSIAGRSRRQP